MISAASSANGAFLVTSELVTGPDLGHGERKINSEIFHVLRQFERYPMKEIALRLRALYGLRLGILRSVQM